MIRSALVKVAWVGRTASIVFGLALVMALVLGATSVALAGNLDPLKIGSLKNVATKTTQLMGKVATGSAFVVKNPSGGSALGLSVGDPLADPAAKTVAPMKVDSQAKVGNLNADELDGMDSAQFAQLGGFKATEVIDISGPLPRAGTFTSNGGTLLISASGSGYRSSTDTTSDAGRIGMRVMIDGQLREGVETYTNDADSHKAFVSNNFVVTNLAAGTHNITLERAWDSQLCGTQDEHEFIPCTTTDGGDNFHVSVLEIPK